MFKNNAISDFFVKTPIENYVRQIIKPLTGENDQPVIHVNLQDKYMIINIVVDNQNVGRVIGKQGVVVKAIQTLLVAGFVKGRYQLLIDVNGRGGKPAVL